MNTFVRCGKLFTGAEDEPRRGAVLVIARQGGSPMSARSRRPAARGRRPADRPFRPFRDARTDRCAHPSRLRQRQERGGHRPLQPDGVPHPARHVLRAEIAAAGYTAICSPGDAGQISLSIRNAVRAGLFDGPRVMAAGPLHHDASGADRLVPDLDRRARRPRSAGSSPISTRRSRKSAGRSRTASTASSSRSTASSAARTAS